MLKEYRIKRGYTLEKLAELCDISWRNLQRIENGKIKTAKFETIAKIIEKSTDLLDIRYEILDIRYCGF